MPSTYTDNLGLVLPATGELNETWGLVFNSSGTSLIEEAIVGMASLSTWVANAMTITTTDGATSSGRCLMLSLTGTLTGTGTLTVPTAKKMYLVRNNTTGGYDVTVKMAAGTTVTVPNGQTYMVYADGSNVEVCMTGVSLANSLKSNSTTGNMQITGPAAGATRVMTIPDANATLLTTNALVTVGQGGTGVNTLTVNGVVLGNGTGALQTVAPGTSGNILTSNGTTWISTPLTGITVGDTSLAITDSGANGTIIFTNDAVESMRITSAGNVGIGTNSPGADLHVKRTSTDTSLIVETTDGSSAATFDLISSTYSVSQGVDNTGGYWSLSSGRYAFDVGGTDKFYIGSDGSILITGGLRYGYQAAPTSKGAAATLTGAELVVGMLQYTGGAANVQLPTGTNIQAAISSLADTNNYFDWCVVNTGAGTCTITTNTNLTLVGTMTIPTLTSAQFRIRKTGAATFTIYRI